MCSLTEEARRRSRRKARSASFMDRAASGVRGRTRARGRLVRAIGGEIAGRPPRGERLVRPLIEDAAAQVGRPRTRAPPPLEGKLVDRAQGKAIVGRGAVNQKGPEIAFLAAIRAFKATGRTLPVNLVLVAEGEEEIGSPNFHELIADPEVHVPAEIFLHQRTEKIF